MELVDKEIISEDNDQGLIPVDKAEFVTDDKIETSKLWPILHKVEVAWQKMLTQERERAERDDLRDILAKQISDPTRELSERFEALTSGTVIKTERDLLKEEN